VLYRLSANALLKSVIVVMAAVIVIMLAGNAWDSWQRLIAVSRILGVADASGFAFKAMHNLRTDRSATNRALNAPEPIDAELLNYLRPIREAEMPALRSTADRLETIAFAGRETLLPELQRAIKTLAALQSESLEALAKPKAARRETLAKDYMAEETKLVETLEKLSARFEYLRAIHYELRMLPHCDRVQVCTLENKEYLASFLPRIRGKLQEGLRAGIDTSRTVRYAAFFAQSVN